MKISRQQRRALARSAFAVGAVFGSAAADAATITVNSLSDALAPPTDGQCTLREAIGNANANAATFVDCTAGSGADVIDFSVTGTITLAGQQLAITESATIDGPGSASLTIDGNDASRVFSVDDGNAGTLQDVTIRDVTITRGSVPTYPETGGGINSAENLTVVSSVVTDNEANRGGGIHHGTGALTLTDVVLSANHAGDFWGALAAGGGTDVTVTNTEILNNTSVNAGGAVISNNSGDVLIEDTTIAGNAGGGGDTGLKAGNNAGTLTIRRSTISGNTGSGSAVAIWYQATTIENTTISGNTGGGGLYLYGSFPVTVRETTITGNSSTSAGGNVQLVSATNVTFINTVVANGSAPSNADIDATGGSDPTFNYSLVETPGTTTISGTGNVTGVDPQLGPLQNNGGATQTHLPASSSPLVNAGDPACAGCPTTDQRGVTRIIGGRIDIGSVELNAGTVALSSAVYTVAENGGTLLVTVNRTAGSDGAVSVDYTTSSGTAAEGADFTDSTGTLNWASGDTAAKTFNVTIIDDATFEGDETFNITLSNVVGAALGTSAAVATITENDIGTADLSISKVAEASGGIVGQPITYTITVDNAGPSPALSVTVTDILPANTAYVSATPSQGSCSGTTTVICSLGTIGSGGTETITLQVIPTLPGTVANTATVSAGSQPDPNGANNASTSAVAVNPAAAVPTASEWMLFALVSALVALGVVKLRP